MAVPLSAVCISVPGAGRGCSCIPPAGSAEQGSFSPLSVFPGWKKMLIQESMFHSFKKELKDILLLEINCKDKQKITKDNDKEGY